VPRIKTIEARLSVADVARSATFFASTLGFAIETLWPEHAPEFAILHTDGVRLQLGRQAQGEAERQASGMLWLDVEDIAALHAHVATHVRIAWGPEVYWYGRREFGFHDPDGNLLILSEVTSDPPTQAPPCEVSPVR
jgi:catechol 2,3-dioxygenase-like lactoylglutathione lyase family enzyme